MLIDFTCFANSTKVLAKTKLKFGLLWAYRFYKIATGSSSLSVFSFVGIFFE